MSTPKRSSAPPVAQSLHSAAIHLLRKLRRVDSQTPRPRRGGRSTSLDGQARLSALSVIVFTGAISLGQLAQAEQVRPPTMTRIVNALEARGLVVKRAGPGDRRTIQISATFRGKRLLLAARDRRIRSLARHIEDLPESRQKLLRATIPILEALAQKL
jgi:DNA-binding MarR family transcriptional regulator